MTNISTSNGEQLKLGILPIKITNGFIDSPSNYSRRSISYLCSEERNGAHLQEQPSQHISTPSANENSKKLYGKRTDNEFKSNDISLSPKSSILYNLAILATTPLDRQFNIYKTKIENIKSSQSDTVPKTKSKSEDIKVITKELEANKSPRQNNTSNSPKIKSVAFTDVAPGTLISESKNTDTSKQPLIKQEPQQGTKNISRRIVARPGDTGGQYTLTSKQKNGPKNKEHVKTQLYIRNSHSRIEEPTRLSLLTAVSWITNLFDQKTLGFEKAWRSKNQVNKSRKYPTPSGKARGVGKLPYIKRKSRSSKKDTPHPIFIYFDSNKSPPPLHKPMQSKRLREHFVNTAIGVPTENASELPWPRRALILSEDLGKLKNAKKYFTPYRRVKRKNSLSSPNRTTL